MYFDLNKTRNSVSIEHLTFNKFDIKCTEDSKYYPVIGLCRRGVLNFDPILSLFALVRDHIKSLVLRVMDTQFGQHRPRTFCGDVENVMSERTTTDVVGLL